MHWDAVWSGLSYGNRPRLLFEMINRRYEQKKTCRPAPTGHFAKWSPVFLNAACVVSRVDRIIHPAGVAPVECQSYRTKEASEHAEKRAKRKKARKKA